MISRSIIFLFAVGLLLCVSCKGRGKSKESAGDVRYSFTIEMSDSTLKQDVADTIKLGRMREGEVITQTIGIRNIHNEPIIIVGIETTCGCTTVDYPKRPIMPGETSEMTFRFDSKGEKGWQFKAFYILTSINAHRHKIYLTADVSN